MIPLVVSAVVVVGSVDGVVDGAIYKKVII